MPVVFVTADTAAGPARNNNQRLLKPERSLLVKLVLLLVLARPKPAQPEPQDRHGPVRTRFLEEAPASPCFVCGGECGGRPLLLYDVHWFGNCTSVAALRLLLNVTTEYNVTPEYVVLIVRVELYNSTRGALQVYLL